MNIDKMRLSKKDDEYVKMYVNIAQMDAASVK